MPAVLSWGQLDRPEKVQSLAFLGSLLRALRPELGQREKIIWVRRTLHAEVWCFVFPTCRSRLQSEFASGLKKLAPCRWLVSVGNIRRGIHGSTSEHRDGLCAVVSVSHDHLGATASDLGSVGECAN